MLRALALVVASSWLAATLPARAAAPEPMRLAVPSVAHPPDDAATCAALVVGDGLAEILASASRAHVVLDRATTRVLERDGVATGAEREVKLHIVRFERDSDAPLAAWDTPAGLRTFDATDPSAALAELARAVLADLGLPAAGAPALPPFPEGAACAAFARALAAFDPYAPSSALATRDALAALPPSARALARVQAALAEALVRAGRPDEALPIAEAAAAKAPELAAARVALAQAHDWLGNNDAALAAYRTALELPTASLGARVNAGLLELRGGRLAAALEDLELAHARAPTWSVATFNLAMAYVEARDGRAAKALLANATPPGRHVPERELVLAEADLLLGAHDAAFTRARPLLDDRRTATLATGLLARIAAAVELTRPPEPGRPDVLELVRGAIADAAGPAYARLRARLEVALAQVASKRRDPTALDRLRALVRDDPGHAQPLAHRALVVLGGGDVAALASLAAQVEDDETWYDLGVLRARAGDTRGAAEAYERAAALNPRASWALFNRGLIALADGDPAAATRWLEDAHLKDEASSDIQAALAVARARTP